MDGLCKPDAVPFPNEDRRMDGLCKPDAVPFPNEDSQMACVSQAV